VADSAVAGRIRTVVLDGMPLQAMARRQCVDVILASLADGRGGWVFTPNLDHHLRHRRDAAFRAVTAHADLSVADGMPLVWACWLQGTPVPERVCGSDLVLDLAAGAEQRGHSVFLLGSRQPVLDRAVQWLMRRHPRLRVADATLTSRLEGTQPDIIFVALGSPKQELVISVLKEMCPGAWWLGIGCGLDYLAGVSRRAPSWACRSGFEWLFRLCQEPRRMARRYLVNDLPHFFGLMARSLRARRFTRADGA
jgi:N-acetylglucosaminyldiphosphoundecaprenol N-acetyl-beta-D-mannosaminyltransferase